MSFCLFEHYMPVDVAFSFRHTKSDCQYQDGPVNLNKADLALWDFTKAKLFLLHNKYGK